MDGKLDERSMYKRLSSLNQTDDSSMIKRQNVGRPLHEEGKMDQIVESRVPSQGLKPVEEGVEEMMSTQQIIDEHDRKECMFFSPYAQRIVNNWLKNEEKYQCSVNYLDGQSIIKPAMREELIDWIVSLNERFGYRRETLYLCVNILDRYVGYTIQRKNDMIMREDYQLVGIAAYFIACKYEEIYFPTLESVLSFTENVYDGERIIQMEIKIVNALQYELTVPTTNKFLNRYLRVTSNEEITNMSYFVADRMLQSIGMLQWKPSIQAAAAIYVARKYLGYEVSWSKEMEEFIGIPKSIMVECATAIHSIILKPSNRNSVVNKYKSSRYKRIYYKVPFATHRVHKT